MKKILTAMSGGVDSTVSTFFLLQSGFETAGAIMRLRDGCQGDVDEARAAAEQLGIPFYEFDLRQQFQEKVIAPFQAVYQNGGTPNPCVQCNRHLKFGAFLAKAEELGYDGMATGHYARIQYDAGSGRYLLLRSQDAQKDQSYFLYMLQQEQLAKVLFPLDSITKQQVREIAAQLKLPAAQREESQDICFVPNGDYMAFLLGRGMVPHPGRFLDMHGKPLGAHQGMEAYTIGQRRGLGIAMGERAYVVRKDQADVYLGAESELYSRRVLLQDVNYIALSEPSSPLCLTAKLRYRQPPALCTLYPQGERSALLEFSAPQRAVTLGQYAVFYDGDVVLGGGEITGALA